MADYPEHVDETGCIPKDIMEKLARYQFISPIIPKEYGGAGADYVSYAIIMEEISKDVLPQEPLSQQGLLWLPCLCLTLERKYKNKSI